MDELIYLDNAATTYPKSEAVYKALDEANRNYAFNAGRGFYKAARAATKIIEDTKGKILDLVGAKNYASVAFTPSITVALNQILNGIDFHKGDTVIVSPYEHNAVARTIHFVQEKRGIQVIEMPLSKDTLEIDLAGLEYLMVKEKPKCVCSIHVSNVTGYILPVKEIFDMAKKHGAITILDTAQSLGLVPVDINDIPVDFIAFAGHKTLYGPFGIGGFIDNSKIKLEKYIVGGTGSNSLNLDMPQTLPERYESSSTNVVAIAGLKVALDEVDIARTYKTEKKLLEYMVKSFSEVEQAVMYLPPFDRHIGMLSFNLKGFKASDVGEILNSDFDIAVRTGYHCAPFIHKWLEDDEYTGTVRASLGKFTTKEDIDALINALIDLQE